MSNSGSSKSRRIRAKLDHPVIDADGHMSEIVPLYLDFVRQVAGPEIGERYAARFGKGNVYGHTMRGGASGLVDPRDPEVREWRTPRGPFWSAPWRNLDDCATRYLPKLLHERMDDMGLDFAFLYPGIGLALPHEPDEQIRLGAVRALNTYYADLTRGLTDRMAVAAVIPMYNPQEAIAELEHVTGSLGAKAIMIPPGVWRPIPGVHREHPDVWPHAGWLDNYGVDSEHDYDAFWQRCMDLKVAVTCHGGMVPCMMWNGRSMSNFTFNHLGNMALQQSWTCKSLLMGGVTTRFPRLPFAFLECGVGWACMLYADLIGHWEKRNMEVVGQFDPASVDREGLIRLFRQYGIPRLQQMLDKPEGFLPPATRVTDPFLLDEFRLMKIRRKEDFKPLFTEQLYFGCEADDPITAWAFDRSANPFDSRLKAMLGSDIGHFDQPDMTRVLEEAYELVEDERISTDDFREFAFENAAMLHLSMNPAFFKGTRIEQAATALLAKRAPQTAGALPA
jgi:predicted TIM-barrel fold metal-dependent hydrolase